MADLSTPILFYAISAGFLPPLFWLWFWLKEDNNPEPRKRLMSAFLGGMIVVPAAVTLEYFVSIYAGISTVSAFFIWAFVEEGLKYGAAKESAMSKPEFDEPVDALIYMIAAALGFAGLENTLFIIKSFLDGGIFSSLDIGSIRFIGATLLHTASSAIVGSAIAFSFSKKEKRGKYVFAGIIIASALHFAFNYFIINNSGGNMLKILIPLWLIIIGIIFIFEKVKKNNR